MPHLTILQIYVVGDLIDNQLKECTIEQKDTLLQVKDKLLRSKFNSDTFASEMSKINYLRTTLN